MPFILIYFLLSSLQSFLSSTPLPHTGSFVHSYVHISQHSSIHSSIHRFIHSFLESFVHSSMRPFIHACAHSFNFYHRSCSRRRSRASPALWHDAQPISLDWPCLLLAARERRSTSMGSTKSSSSTDAGRLVLLLLSAWGIRHRNPTSTN